MMKSVLALKAMYEKALFPNLDMTRSELGKRIDNALQSRKGRIMDQITHDHNDMLSRSYEELNSLNDSSNGSSNGSLSEAIMRSLESEKETKVELFYDTHSRRGSRVDINLDVSPPPGCPFHVPPSTAEVPPAPPARCPSSPIPTNFDAIRRKLYSTKNVPAVFSQVRE